MSNFFKKKLNKNNKKKKKSVIIKKIKQESKEPLQSLSTHGLSSLFRARHIVFKILWMILFLGGLGVSIYFVYKTISEFLEYRVNSSSSLVYVDELDYPYFTICNSQQLSTNQSIEYIRQLLNQKGFDYDKIKLNQSYYGNSLLQGYPLFEYLRTLVPYQLLYYLPIEQRKNYTYYGIDNQSINDFVWIHNPYYGNCQTMNKKKFIGVDDGALELNYSFYVLNADDFPWYDLVDGYYVKIHDDAFNPFDELNSDNRFFIETSMTTKLAIKKSVIKKYPKPYSNCDFVNVDNKDEFPKSNEFDIKYYNQIKDAGYKYSQSMCISFCILDYLRDDFRLRVSSIKSPYTSSYCPNSSMYIFDINFDETLSDLYKHMYQNNHIKSLCRKKCPLECISTKFETKISTQKSLYPEIADFTIVYNNLEYTLYEEEPLITVFGMISNVGGVIGLFLGMSLLSVFEFFEVCLQSVIIVIRHKIKNRKTKQPDIVQEV